ncbi:MAG: SDR family oxidoreductase [Balneolaceae bacterium]
MTVFDQEKLRERYSNKTAIVTGGASGIGLAISRKLSALDILTYILDRNEPEEKIENTRFIKTDITYPGDIKSAHHQIQSDNQTPDILVNNAGVGIHQKLSEGDPDKWAMVFETNVLGMLRFIRLFLPAMAERKSGDILFISSVSASRTYQWGGIYAASKAALETVAETLRLETQPELRVSTIVAGVVNTPFFDKIIDGVQTPESIGWGALSAEDIANAVMYVISQPVGVAVNNLVIRPSAQPM